MELRSGRGLNSSIMSIASGLVEIIITQQDSSAQVRRVNVHAPDRDRDTHRLRRCLARIVLYVCTQMHAQRAPAFFTLPILVIEVQDSGYDAFSIGSSLEEPDYTQCPY
jgi:hypothetical protein